MMPFQDGPQQPGECPGEAVEGDAGASSVEVVDVFDALRGDQGRSTE
jgi:hypothetical protein